MNSDDQYPIGTPGVKWGDRERQQWLQAQSRKRSYREEVLLKLEQLNTPLKLECYGELNYGEHAHQLLALRTELTRSDKPVALITGGVHGYETSGVQGAIRFLETKASAYAQDFELVVLPCVSPWAYETINRWNALAIDPNRSFHADSPAPESAQLMHYLTGLGVTATTHIDLHETTDTDNSEFRPALAARDAVEHDNWCIPDGFYLVGDTLEPAAEFQTAIIDAVEKVTHIAPADASGRIIGETLAQRGVINYATRALGLCAGITDAPYRTTTEVYPDSPQATDEICIQAQVVAICSGLDYIHNHSTA